LKALLLAAGEGTRLRPLTQSLPKCLMPILGVPLLEYWLQAVRAMGISDCLVNTNYLSEVSENFLSHVEFAGRLKIVHEARLLGTCGTLDANSAFWGHDSLMVVHADNLSVFDGVAFGAAFAGRAPGVVGTMMTFETDHPESCGILEIGVGGRVMRMYEKVANPPGHIANAAVYIFSDEVRARVRGLSDISTQLLPRLMGFLNVYANTGYHRDIGTLDSYLKANEDLWSWLGRGRLKPLVSRAWGEVAPTCWDNWCQAWALTGKHVTLYDSGEQFLRGARHGEVDGEVVLIRRCLMEDLLTIATLKREGKLDQGQAVLVWQTVAA